jgi:hypothetical protein
LGYKGVYKWGLLVGLLVGIRVTRVTRVTRGTRGFIWRGTICGDKGYKGYKGVYKWGLLVGLLVGKHQL